MANKHTKGPWKIEDEGLLKRFRTVIKSGEAKARTVVIIENWTTPADARLIAAAPEMYELLKAVLEVADDAFSHAPLWAQDKYTFWTTERDKTRDLLARIDGGE